jgi:DNA repair protein RecN (Recombination protein N)
VIERICIKDNHLFKKCELEFDSNLIIFSGASGSGKSVFMNLLLTLFGYKDEQSSLIEASVKKELELEEYGIENEEENIFRRVTTKSSRYFINGSQLSKKNILAISKSFINYLNLREFSEFENKNLIYLLDNIAKKSITDHESLLSEFEKDFKLYRSISKQLQEIEEKEKKIEDLKEFAKFEIEKIESINPKIGEYDELLELKKKLSKKEKIESAIESASMINEFETKVIDALNLLDEDSTFFTEAINELNIKLENAKESLSELEELDIEELLNRLEDLSSLKNRYGSIEEALEYLEEKRRELASYENISFEKEELKKSKQKLEDSLTKVANTLTKNRTKALKVLNQDINSYTKMLYLNEITFELNKTSLNELGFDEVSLTLGNTTLQKVSSGELNRIRLSFLATSAKYIQNGGVLILDEIDANLSGKESDAVAKVLYELSNNYQIFAISHQPQLSSYATEHYVVSKNKNNNSSIKKLKKDERIEELARMISGENISDEAKEFAKKLLKEKR